MKNLSPERLRELEDRMKILVPELRRDHHDMIAFEDGDHRHCSFCGLYAEDFPDINDQECVSKKITLEHCIAALEKHYEGKRYREFMYRRDEISAVWEMLQPWESQTEVHQFLIPYLLSK